MSKASDIRDAYTNQSIPAHPDAVRAAAAVTVACNATDMNEAHELLDMLDLKRSIRPADAAGPYAAVPRYRTVTRVTGRRIG